MFFLKRKEVREVQVALRLSGRQPFHNVPVCSRLGRCWGAVSLCARRKEQRSAQIADICSFFLNPPTPLPLPLPLLAGALQRNADTECLSH